MKYCFLIAMLFGLFACEDNKIESFLITLWAVEVIEINGEEFNQNEMYGNTLLFKNDGTCKLPGIDKVTANCNWKLSKNNKDKYVITIFNSDYRKEYNGEYRLIIKSTHPIKHISMISEDVKINCASGL